MNKKWMLLTMLLVLTTIFFIGCGKAWQPTKVERQDIDTISHSVCEGVCSISKVSKGTNGAPILIFEENHLSRAGQIQHAIAMVRLYKQYKLRHIALEGYLKEDREIRTDWFDKVSGDLTVTRKAEIAVRLLKEGEISSAEFMKLAYKDILIHPIETKEEYSVDLDKNASAAPILYLLKIAYKSLTEEHFEKLQTLQKDFEELEGDKKEKKRREMFDYILSIDAWAQEKYKILTDSSAFKKITSEQFVSMLKKIENHAKELYIELTEEEQEAMRECIRFWHCRDIASITMGKTVEKIADQSDVSIVAMIVGAAHTEKICKLLRTSGYPFAVATPLSFDLTKGDLTVDMLDRKYKKLSVYSEGFTEILLKALSSSTQKKYPSVLSEPWLQCKAELYLFIERIVERVLEGGGGSGNKKPPYGFSVEDLRGNWISIDPNRISILSKDQSVLFPIIINGDQNLWIKAKRSNEEGAINPVERESVESMLKRALKDVQSENKIRVESKGGRVQITIDTVAGIAKTKEAAVEMAL